MNLADFQIYLHYAEDNNNFESDFLLAVDFFTPFPHITIYPGVILDFFSKTINL